MLLVENATPPEGPYVEPISWDENYLDTDKKYLAIYNTLQSLLTKFDMELNAAKKENDDSIRSQNPAYTTPYFDEEAEHGTYEEALESYIRDNYFWASLRQTERKTGFPDHEETLRKFISNIHKLSKGQNHSKFVTVSLYETDTSMVDVWARARPENNLFGGAGRRISDKRAVYIYGDRQLIKDYLIVTGKLSQTWSGFDP